MLLKDASVKPPVVPEGMKPVWHHYAVNVEDRDVVQEKLKAERIETGVPYPIPLHLQPAYRSFGYKPGDFPHAERVARNILSLPIYPARDKGAGPIHL
jgi:dTDP-4-amino-4,6-dideoxygalactose transaminase